MGVDGLRYGTHPQPIGGLALAALVDRATWAFQPAEKTPTTPAGTSEPKYAAAQGEHQGQSSKP
eukprot:351786-Chlamydomonas_euryale.AAC.4